ncbi:MAG: hypothetical protein IIV23_00170 [Ruminococcus sp.]|nr:hypothetical protein [Ruminococcus sp.]
MNNYKNIAYSQAVQRKNKTQQTGNQKDPIPQGKAIFQPISQCDPSGRRQGNIQTQLRKPRKQTQILHSDRSFKLFVIYYKGNTALFQDKVTEFMICL